MSTDSEAKAVKCVGIWGRLFGHKYRLTLGDYHRQVDHCVRCGLAAGWTP